MNSNDPVAFIRWMAQTTHASYHKSSDWEKCRKETCVSARRFIKDFSRDEKVWVAADGRVIPIREMEDSHLYNAYKFVKRKVSRTISLAASMGIDNIRTEDVISNHFPVMNDLKAEMIRREALKVENYKGTRNLDI